ncbi:MAG: lycopene cyclase domain-containing protein [Alphaproteobacteria bacterium]|nr:lycopene cyclase domain-containing protein [Alphaproteobacteria bacterium]
MPEQYVWAVWASAFLVPWLGLYLFFPSHRRAMLWASVFTAPFGLTEPLFVPEYWNPPSLFDLARTTGFDIESIIFCFGIGGSGAVLYNVMTGAGWNPVPAGERTAPRHRYHGLAIATPFIAFVLLYYFPWNPIYPSITAMFLGALATMACRPDLKTKTWIGGLLFLVHYAVFLWGLEGLAPGYIGRVWNLDALSGLNVMGMPVEELLFATAFGMYWAGVYDHFTWRRSSSGER